MGKTERYLTCKGAAVSASRAEGHGLDVLVRVIERGTARRRSWQQVS
jgi:hypothetical protein